MAFAPPPAPRRAAGGDTAIDPQRLLQILTTVELEALGAGRAEVHQAAGMVSVQLSVSVAEARLRLRKRALRREPAAGGAGRRRGRAAGAF